MSTVLITQELFNNMDFDTQKRNENSARATSEEVGNRNPSALIIFSNSDINAAIYHLIKSLNSPFDAQAIATVLVQESVKKDFIEKLLQQSKFNNNITKVKRNEVFNKAMETAKTLKAEFILPHSIEETNYQHCIVCDITHEHLGPTTTPSGIVTLHTFRTAKEAITLVNKESLQFTNISIWQENHGHAYELVSQLKSRNFFINCHLVSLHVLEASISQGKNYVVMDKSYHYETMQHDGVQKSIAFPIGSIFAN